MLKIGDSMPHFEVMDQDGNVVRSAELLGRKTIIYFYPKDNTSGCTAEACNLRDNYERAKVFTTPVINSFALRSFIFKVAF